MNKCVFYNLNQDIKDLKQAKLEINWAIARADKLENARDFGRCLTCGCPLNSKLHIICGDCLSDDKKQYN